MNELYMLYAKYTEIRAAAWVVWDGLVAKGLNKDEIDIHPDYITALELEHAAFAAYQNERDK